MGGTVRKVLDLEIQYEFKSHIGILLTLAIREMRCCSVMTEGGGVCHHFCYVIHVNDIERARLLT